MGHSFIARCESMLNDKIDNPEETLKNILDFLQSRLYDINDALHEDGEIDAGGNSYNSCEAGGFFKHAMKQIQDMLPDHCAFDFDSATLNLKRKARI